MGFKQRIRLIVGGVVKFLTELRLFPSLFLQKIVINSMPYRHFDRFCLNSVKPLPNVMVSGQ